MLGICESTVVARWVGSMNTPAHSGHFLDNDSIPDTLLTILKSMFTECMPALMASIKANAIWLDANPGASELPRAVGEHKFTIGGKRGTRAIR